MGRVLDSATRRRLVDADSHALEPPDLWTKWLPAAWHDAAPRLAPDGEGGQGWVHRGSEQAHPIGLLATAGQVYDDVCVRGLGYDEIRPGCYEPAARLCDMDTDGVAAAVVSGPQGTIARIRRDPERAYVLAAIEALNRFVIEGFCGRDRTRLGPIPQIPALDLDSSLRVLADSIEAGAAGVLIPGWPSGGARLTMADDPYWAAAAEAGIPVCIHLELQAPQSAAAPSVSGASSNGDSAAAEPSGAGEVAALAAVFHKIARPICELILTGTFDRVPGLKIVLLEAGGGWIPYLLEQLNDRYWRNRSWSRVALQRTPSEYWHDNMATVFTVDRVAVGLRAAIGIENLLWSSDYPHHVTDWPYSRASVDSQFNGVDPHEVDAIAAQNAVRLFGFELAGAL
jgi:predicted TIM-barrel fold metal-dependent hydrolase